MRVIIFSGNHSRHLYIHEEIVRFGVECAAVVMEREQLIPNVPLNIPEVDRRNFVRHFNDRHAIELSAYGHLQLESVFSNISLHKCQTDTLNSDATASFVREFDADIAFIFGTDLIKEPVLSALPETRVNLHLGLSPWYRGSATLFWPFYFLQPQFAGATFHQILPEADAGGVLHQTVPKLQSGDGIHDVGAKTVIEARKDLKKLLEGYGKSGWFFEEQKSSGRLFLTRDFQPAHLRLIYNTYDNNIVDAYLNGQLELREPNIVVSKLVADV
jgi:methionyl-tRNA formyltransferase